MENAVLIEIEKLRRASLSTLRVCRQWVFLFISIRTNPLKQAGSDLTSL